MATWVGPAPVGSTNRTSSIRSWADDRSNGWTNPDGSEVRWWEALTADTFGVQYPSPSCSGAKCEDIYPCVSCEEMDCEECGGDECLPDAPGWADAKPFWVKHGYKGCTAMPTGAQQLYDRAVSEIDEFQWAQIARRYHMCLQEEATDITGDSVSTLTEGLGALLRARGVLGLQSGGLVVPYYAMPMMTSKGLIGQSGGGPVLNGLDIPIYTDPGLPVSGPGGLAPPPGAAFVYVVSGPPTVAVRNELLPGGPGWQWSDSTARAMFFDDMCGCGGCFQPFVKRRAVVACHGACSFAIAVDVRDCDCPDPLVFGPAEEAEGTAEEETKAEVVKTATVEKVATTETAKRAG